MRSLLSILFVLFCAGILLPAFAQQQNRQGNRNGKNGTDTAAAHQGKAAKKTQLRVTLGGVMPDTVLRKRVLDSIARFRLTPDEPGAVVQNFMFTYAERNLYEDSVGNLIIQTDLLSEQCVGDTLPKYLCAFLTERSKPGDTAWFENIRILRKTGAAAEGIPIKMAINRQ